MTQSFSLSLFQQVGGSQWFQWLHGVQWFQGVLCVGLARCNSYWMPPRWSAVWWQATKKAGEFGPEEMHTVDCCKLEALEFRGRKKNWWIGDLQGGAYSIHCSLLSKLNHFRIIRIIFWVVLDHWGTLECCSLNATRSLSEFRTANTVRPTNPLTAPASKSIGFQFPNFSLDFHETRLVTSWTRVARTWKPLLANP